MFIAIHGPRFDGNDYANNAILNGASIVVVNRKIETNSPMIIVKNSINFLENLGAINRKTNSGIFIGVTGSIGKTTTKEIISKILSKNHKTYSTPSNQNNYIGLPLTLSNNPNDTEFSIIEISMSNKGEIAKKSKLVMPNIAIVTSTGFSHAGNFNEPIEIANTKSEIFDYLQKDGIAIICSTGELSNKVIENAKTHQK
uniref:Mur ligase central domain-containing protein n=1 Tax=Biomphalaria glabrata TaxID=6526 RepID=A0A2C9LVR0_BIOGL